MLRIWISPDSKFQLNINVVLGGGILITPDGFRLIIPKK